jgi:hypothetical protein
MIFGAAFALEPSKPILPSTWLPNPHENWLDRLRDDAGMKSKCATLCLRLVVRIEELTLDRKVRQNVAS